MNLEPTGSGEISAPPPPSPSGAPRKIIAGVIVIVIVLVALIGYGITGYAFATSRITSAHHSLNTVIDHENAITKSFNDLAIQLSAVTISNTTTEADLTKYRGLSDQLVSSSQAAVPTVESDAAVLGRAASALNEQRWLTVLSKGRMDRESQRLGHARKALADAKTIAGDYVQLGQFYQAYFDGRIDLSTGATASNQDLAGAKGAAQALKADAARGQSLAKAPGLPDEVLQYETDLAALAADLENLINAIQTGDTSGGSKYVQAVEAEAAKVDAHDWSKIGDQIAAYYKPIIDDYNSESHKATS